MKILKYSFFLLWICLALLGEVFAQTEGQISGNGQFCSSTILTVDKLKDLKLFNPELLDSNFIFLNERGGGLFRWVLGDQSGKIAKDLKNGVYVAPDSSSSGAFGAWIRVYNGSVSVDWFGAIPDSVQSGNSAAIQAALDFTPDGGTVDLQGKTYYIDNPLRFHDRNYLTLKNGRLIALNDWDKGNADAVKNIPGKPMIALSSSKHTACTYNQLINLQLDGNHKAPGVHINNVRGTNIMNFTCEHFSVYGVMTKKKAGETKLFNLSLAEWLWGEPGWYDSSLRTAHGLSLRTADAQLDNIVSRYSKYPFYFDDFWNGQFSNLHPYNGSDPATQLTNIYWGRNANGGVFTNIYNDNGYIDIHNGNVQFNSIKGTKTAKSQCQHVFRLFAQGKDDQVEGLQISDVVTATNKSVLLVERSENTFGDVKCKIEDLQRTNGKKIEGTTAFFTQNVKKSELVADRFDTYVYVLDVAKYVLFKNTFNKYIINVEEKNPDAGWLRWKLLRTSQRGNKIKIVLNRATNFRISGHVEQGYLPGN